MKTQILARKYTYIISPFSDWWRIKKVEDRSRVSLKTWRPRFHLERIWRNTKYDKISTGNMPTVGVIRLKTRKLLKRYCGQNIMEIGGLRYDHRLYFQPIHANGGVLNMPTTSTETLEGSIPQLYCLILSIFVRCRFQVLSHSFVLEYEVFALALLRRWSLPSTTLSSVNRCSR